MFQQRPDAMQLTILHIKMVGDAHPTIQTQVEGQGGPRFYEENAGVPPKIQKTTSI